MNLIDLHVGAWVKDPSGNPWVVTEIIPAGEDIMSEPEFRVKGNGGLVTTIRAGHLSANWHWIRPSIKMLRINEALGLPVVREREPLFSAKEYRNTLDSIEQSLNILLIKVFGEDADWGNTVGDRMMPPLFVQKAQFLDTDCLIEFFHGIWAAREEINSCLEWVDHHSDQEEGEA